MMNKNMDRCTTAMAFTEKKKLERTIQDLLTEYMDATGLRVAEVFLQWEVTEAATFDDPDMLVTNFRGVKLSVEL